MRYRWIRNALATVAAVMAGGNAAKAQFGPGSSNNYDIPGNPAIQAPLPIGPVRAGDGGFYTAIEAVMMRQTRALGTQTLAVRGFRDSLGTFTGNPGQFVGSGETALTTEHIGRGSFQPGYNITIGYKLADGMAFEWSYLSLLEAKYTASASGPGIGLQSAQGNLNQNTFLYSNVFNFTPFFSGPRIKTFDDDFSNRFDLFPVTGRLYGIWNGSTFMNIVLQQRFTQSDLTVRVPIWDTDYSRTYGLGGLRFAWFFERFTWRTTSVDVNGSYNADDVGIYINTLSQRMYGPYLGCGNEVYLGNAFAASLDLSGAALVDLAKEQAKYERGDKYTQSKRSRDQYNIVPNVNLKASMWWYPLRGVQMRASYTAQTYFNTVQMDQPVGFNFGDIDPSYTTRVFRLVQGIEIGLGISF